MRKLLGLTVSGLLAAGAYANLLPGDVRYNPQLNGTGAIGSSGPFYTAGTPAWLNNANLLQPQLVSSISAVPGFAEFTGTVTSGAYFVNGVDATGGLGFAYRISLASDSAGNLVRASMGSLGWGGVTIYDAGATGDGNSTQAGATPRWSDGDPYFIERDAFGESPQWTFRLGSRGTVLNANNSSAWVWFETDGQFVQRSTIALLDGGATGAAFVLVPNAIPSPAAGALALVGTGLIAGLRRRIG